MATRIRNCYSCFLCDLTATRTCRECDTDFCMMHYVCHLERTHDFDLTKREDCLKMAERSAQDQLVCS